MSILVDRHTRVITQGVTGKSGRLHTAMCRAYGHGGECFVAGVNPRRAGESFEGMPVYGTVAEAKARTGATVSVIYVPPALAAGAIEEAVDADLDLVVCITEGIPVHDMLRIRERLRGRRTRLLGPNGPGIVTPGEVKIGIMPGDVHTPGPVGVISRTGSLTVEAVRQLSEWGLGQSTVVGIGADAVGGLQAVDVLRLFNDDPDTEAVVMVGEIGGDAEQAGAQWIREHMRKPVVAYIAGVTAPHGRPMGHAGALISKGRDTAEAKLAVMQACGIHVTRDPAGIGKLLESVLGSHCLPFD
jgi:succinyl-CoA synthetase alpha subunit